MSALLSRLTAAIVLAVALSGCMSAELARVHRDVEQDLPGIGGGHAFQFGRLSMAVARRFAGGDDPATKAALRAVHGVAIGTYALNGPVSSGALTLRQATARIEGRGWQPVVVSRDGTEATFLYTRSRGDVLRDLLVMSFEDGELTLVRINGHFNEATLAAMMKSSDGPLASMPSVWAPVQKALHTGAPRPVAANSSE